MSGSTSPTATLSTLSRHRYKAQSGFDGEPSRQCLGPAPHPRQPVATAVDRIAAGALYRIKKAGHRRQSVRQAGSQAYSSRSQAMSSAAAMPGNCS